MTPKATTTKNAFALTSIHFRTVLSKVTTNETYCSSSASKVFATLDNTANYVLNQGTMITCGRAYLLLMAAEVV